MKFGCVVKVHGEPFMSPSSQTRFTFCMRFRKRRKKPARAISTSRPRSGPLKTNRRQALKKTDPRIDDTRITDCSGNVFVDLGFDEAEAKVMALRVELIVQLRETLTKQGLTQAEAAKQLGVTQPRVSALLKGTWKDFSIDMLLTFAARLGLQPRLMFAS